MTTKTGSTDGRSVMRDNNGIRWLTVKEAVSETGMSLRTVREWIAGGLPTQLVRGRRWLREPELFAKLRASLSENQRVKTRFQNRR